MALGQEVALRSHPPPRPTQCRGCVGAGPWDRQWPGGPAESAAAEEPKADGADAPADAEAPAAEGDEPTEGEEKEVEDFAEAVAVDGEGAEAPGGALRLLRLQPRMARLPLNLLQRLPLRVARPPRLQAAGAAEEAAAAPPADEEDGPAEGAEEAAAVPADNEGEAAEAAEAAAAPADEEGEAAEGAEESAAAPVEEGEATEAVAEVTPMSNFLSPARKTISKMNAFFRLCPPGDGAPISK